jgi:S-DNA-T family DNA segregation ATPase FtsK/SpoIIIE
MHQRPRDLQIALFDPKAHGFAAFANQPHLLFPIASQPEQILLRLGYLVAEMERRDRERIERPRIVIAIDELADILQACGAQVEALLTRLVQRGRSAGLSVVACTQKPTAQAVGSLMRANFPVRLVGRVTSADDARVAAGVGGTGAEKLAGRGDFLLIAGGQVIRFQAARSSERDLAITVTPRSDAHDSETFGSRMMGRLRRVK